MTKTPWISGLLHRLGIRDHSLGLSCVVLVRRGDVRLELLECPLPCGHTSYRIDLAYYAAAQDDWVEIASLRDFCLDDVVHLLQEAQQCITNLRRL